MNVVPAYPRQAYEHQMACAHRVPRLAFTALATGALRPALVDDVRLFRAPVDPEHPTDIVFVSLSQADLSQLFAEANP